MSGTYTCEMCKGVFEKGWSDEEAMAEAHDMWGPIPEENRAVICDDCFQIMVDPSRCGGSA